VKKPEFLFFIDIDDVLVKPHYPSFQWVVRLSGINKSKIPSETELENRSHHIPLVAFREKFNRVTNFFWALIVWVGGWGLKRGKIKLQPYIDVDELYRLISLDNFMFITAIPDWTRNKRASYFYKLFRETSKQDLETRDGHKVKSLDFVTIQRKMLTLGDMIFSKTTKQEVIAKTAQKIGLSMNQTFLIDDAIENIEDVLNHGGHAILVIKPWNRNDKARLLAAFPNTFSCVEGKDLLPFLSRLANSSYKK